MAEARFRNMWAFLRESDYGELADAAGDMRCTICTRILIDAHSCTGCGCRYCLGCLQEYLAGGSRLCPGDMDECRLEPLDIGSNVLPDHAINHRISKLTVACRHWCGHRCELRSMEEHERACGRRPISCPYVSAGCTAMRLASDAVNEHLVGEAGAHAALLMARIDALQEEVAATRRKAGRVRAELAAVRSAREIDEARAARAGAITDRVDQEVGNVRNENICLRADVELHRADHLVHVADTELQLAELRARADTQARDILEAGRQRAPLSLWTVLILVVCALAIVGARLEQRAGELGAALEMQQRGGLLWRVDGWAAKSQSARAGDQERVFSDAFYSHEHGYRMCLSVWPDGYYGAGKGTHLAVYFHLMPGPFDNMLPWPFRRAVTLSLVDPRTGGAHASDTVTFDDFPNDADWGRPAVDRNAGFGTFELAELAALARDDSLCRDDAIFIRCTVQDATAE